MVKPSREWWYFPVVVPKVGGFSIEVWDKKAETVAVFTNMFDAIDYCLTHDKPEV